MMAQFGMLKSFNIDNGELDGLRPQECFVLGYELAQIDRLLNLPEPFSRSVHSSNRQRILDACNDSGRNFTLAYMHNDPSESWMQLDVI